MGVRVFSPDEIAWLRRGYRKWRLFDLTDRFNSKFGRALKASQIRTALHNRGITCGRLPGFSPGERPPLWTRERQNWLRRHRPHASIAELVARAPADLGIALTAEQIKSACSRLRIHGGQDRRFRPGMTPWNAGLKGFQAGGRAADTQFKPGDRPHTWEPIGTYKRVSKGGYWKLKFRDESVNNESRHNWVYVHRLTYTDHHGPIPKGHVVLFLDGNTDHCLDPDNLIAVPRGVLAIANKLGWQTLTDRDERRAVLAMAQLRYAAAERGREAGLSPYQRKQLMTPIRPLEATA